MNTHEFLIDAIRNRKVLSLVYSEIDRVVEPHAYGQSTAGNDVLRCWQVSGGHQSDEEHTWDLLVVDRISYLRDTGTSFVGSRPGYAPGDKGMSRIYQELPSVRNHMDHSETLARRRPCSLTTENPWEERSR